VLSVTQIVAGACERGPCHFLSVC